MEQVSDKILVIGPGEAIPEGTESAIKILLLGSIDTREDHKFDWADKFIKGMIDITDPQKGILQYQNYNFVIVNGTITIPNMTLNAMDQNFVMKMQWTYQTIASVDSIFINFLKKSTSQMPLYWLGVCSSTQKLTVRAPEEYINYGVVRLTCQINNIPLISSKTGSVLDALNNIAAFTPKFQELMKYQLPE